MRFLIGAVAGTIWIMLMTVATEKTGLGIAPDTQWLTTAIIVAGAMAGGDG